MKIINTVKDMQLEARDIIKSSQTHGFVPTMGNLHEGHLSLIRKAAEENDVVSVSIFVNPSQFEDPADLEEYPRTVEDDIEAASEAGADIIFLPEAEDMYSERRDTVVLPNKLTEHLCGLSRGKAHFIGVCTVVAKLFNIFLPSKAYFGQKDAQQALIIQRMVIDLNFPVEIVISPIIREEDGLAMSSRNARIKEGRRESALSLYRALNIGREMIEKQGIETSSEIINAMAESILENDGVEIDYIDIVSTETLEDAEKVDDVVMIAGAIRLDDDLRLIDNILTAPGGK